MTVYDRDYYKWTNDQVLLLHQKDYENLDVIHLMEEIESLGNSEKNKLQSHLTILYMHLLKYEYQPSKRSRSWETSIKLAKLHAKDCLDDNPSLKSKLILINKKAYRIARHAASQETGLNSEAFPEECLWNINELLNDEEKK